MEGVELKEEWQDEDFPMWAMFLNENKFKTELHYFFTEVSLTKWILIGLLKETQGCKMFI